MNDIPDHDYSRNSRLNPWDNTARQVVHMGDSGIGRDRRQQVGRSAFDIVGS